ncbi:MAG: hypothetical protein ABR981_02245 [Candidatus Micrarchaeaceae archaeon]|jgi:hypothetical protein
MPKQPIKITKIKFGKMSPEEVETILKTKYNVPQVDINYLDEEFKLKLLKDLLSTPMLNEKA